jgi:hypothetical protein
VRTILKRLLVDTDKANYRFISGGYGMSMATSTMLKIDMKHIARMMQRRKQAMRERITGLAKCMCLEGDILS